MLTLIIAEGGKEGEREGVGPLVLNDQFLSPPFTITVVHPWLGPHFQHQHLRRARVRLGPAGWFTASFTQSLLLLRSTFESGRVRVRACVRPSVVAAINGAPCSGSSSCSL